MCFAGWLLQSYHLHLTEGLSAGHICHFLARGSSAPMSCVPWIIMSCCCLLSIFYVCVCMWVVGCFCANLSPSLMSCVLMSCQGSPCHICPTRWRHGRRATPNLRIGPVWSTWRGCVAIVLTRWQLSHTRAGFGLLGVVTMIALPSRWSWTETLQCFARFVFMLVCLVFLFSSCSLNSQSDYIEWLVLTKVPSYIWYSSL